jgi:hypothetical protein
MTRVLPLRCLRASWMAVLMSLRPARVVIHVKVEIFWATVRVRAAFSVSFWAVKLAMV